MDPPEYGCNEDINEKGDDDSIVADKCWQEQHRGDSRKWIMRDGYPKKVVLMSNMKATYSYPIQEEKYHVATRKAILLKKLYDEAAAEIIRERNEPPPVEEYCTEYDGNYNSEGTIQEADQDANKELYEKYPLYSSPAMSFWNFKIEKSRGSKISLPGLTASIDLKNPFKRNSGFTKPISEVLDDCHL